MMLEDDDLPFMAALGDKLRGPKPTFRWSPLEAVAWIATRDLRWVKGVIVQVWGQPLSYWGDAPPVAERAARSLEHDLHRRAEVLPYGESVSKLIEAISTKPIAAFVAGAAISLRNLQLIGLKFTGLDVGFDVLGDETGRFTSVKLDAHQIMREFPAPKGARAVAKAARTIRAESEVAKFLTECFACNDYPVSDWDKPKFRELLGSQIGSRAFDRAWAKAVKSFPERSARGRRSVKRSVH